jgi:LmbE family N-acetylglucosaminyl deacetylase
MAGMPLDPTEISRVLCVAAHPDDLDYGAAGTVGQWTDAGLKVSYLLCTRGDQGGFDDTPREQMPALREREQRAAAAAVGVDDVRFLDGFRDGWLEPSHDLVKAIVRVIRQVRPDRIVIPSADRMWDRIGASHPDHLACGEAAIRAVYPAARNAFAYPELLEQEGLEPWAVREVWVMAHPGTPQHPVDVTDSFDRKIDALHAHHSQTAHMGEKLREMVHGWQTMTAARLGLPEGRLAESFYVITMN